MTPAEIVARAMSQVGRPIRYELGAGGRRWDLSTPAPSGALDCSGFVAWCCGYDRGPRNTDWIVRDVNGARAVFTRPLSPEPGDLVVYGGTFARVPVLRRIRPGHVGVVAEALPAGEIWSGTREQWARIRVVHCSARNHRLPGGSAVAVTSGEIWARRGIVARIKG